MFATLRYVWRVNRRVAALGMSPNALRKEFRLAGIEVGLAAGLSAEETAVSLVKALPIGHQPDGWERAANRWRAEGRIRLPIIEIDSMTNIMGQLHRDALRVAG